MMINTNLKRKTMLNQRDKGESEGLPVPAGEIEEKEPFYEVAHQDGSLIDYSFAILTVEEIEDFQRYDVALLEASALSRVKRAEIYTEAKSKYSNNKNGKYYKWLDARNIKRKTADRDVQYLQMWKTLSEDERRIVSGLPLTLTYGLTAPSTPEELKKEILEGKIKTNKYFKERVTKYKELEEAKENSELVETYNATEDIEEAEIVEEGITVVKGGKVTLPETADELRIKALLGEIRDHKEVISDLEDDINDVKALVVKKRAEIKALRDKKNPKLPTMDKDVIEVVD